MFRRTSIISAALYPQQLCRKISNFNPRAESSRKPFRKRLKNILSKVTERARNRKPNTDKNDIEENTLKPGKSKYSRINLRNLFSKVTLGKLICTRHQQRNCIPSGSGISETLNTNWAPATKTSFDSDLPDKDFQCTSTTALYLLELSEKDDIVNLKNDLFESGFYSSKRKMKLNELSGEKVSEVYTTKFEVSVIQGKSYGGSEVPMFPSSF